MLGDTLRITGKNLHLIYKVLAYVGILMLIAVAVSAAVISPISDALFENADLWEEIVESIEEFGDTHAAQGLAGIGEAFKAFFAAHKQDIWSMVGLLVIVGFIMKLFSCFVAIPEAEVIACYMEKNYRQNFLGAAISSFGKSCVFAFLYTLITTPIDFGLTIGCVYLAKELYAAINILAYPVVAIILVMLISIRICLFGMWVPEMVRGKGRVFASLKENFRLIKHNMKMLLPVTFFFILTGTIFIVSSFLFTMGLSLIVLVPMLMVTQSCAQMIVSFEIHEQKYYR